MSKVTTKVPSKLPNLGPSKDSARASLGTHCQLPQDLFLIRCGEDTLHSR